MQMASGRKALGMDQLNQLKRSGARKPLLLAVALGLAAALMSWTYVQRAGHRPPPVAMVPVVVAAQDIAVRTQITPQMLVIKEVPADARHPKALTALDQANGKVSSLPVAAGEQVLSTKFFARKEDSGLAFQIAPGKRAVSVAVSEVITAGGLINPGDFVDVVGLFSGLPSSGASAANQDFTSVVLQNIEVLAVAQFIQGPAADPQASIGVAGVGGSKPDPAKQDQQARPNARTFTLAVTPEEAQKLILAEEKGKIRLALRGVDDHQTGGVAPTNLDGLRP